MPRTIFLSRLIGLFMLILAIAEALQLAKMLEASNQIVSSAALQLVTGMLTLLAGLAIVLTHNIWRGSVAAVLVTILGWLLLIKGTALLVITPNVGTALLGASGYVQAYPVYVVIPLLLGLFLTYAEFSVRKASKA